MLQEGQALSLTPPPEELITAEAVQEARVRVQLVADRLALSGAARIDTFMHAVSGDIVVVDVAAVPDFGLGSPIMQQVTSPTGMTILGLACCFALALCGFVVWSALQ